VGPSVFITGASGHIGSALAAQLTTSGVQVRGLDRRPGHWVDVVGDLRSVPLAKLVDGTDVVVHCAALHAPHVGQEEDSVFVATNVVATRRLLDAASRAGVSKFVFTSTTSVYGHALNDPDRAVWVDESLVPVPRDVYDLTKLEAESLVQSYHTRRFRTVTLRIARCFHEPPHTTAMNRLYRGVDLRDVVSALNAAIEASLDSHEVMNIAGPRVFERSDIDLLRTSPGQVIAARLPWLADEFSARDWPLPATIDRVYVSDHASVVIGYQPTLGVRDALAALPVADRPNDLPMTC